MYWYGQDLETGGVDGEEPFCVKKLWDAVISMRATTGSREGAAVRLANGLGLPFGLGVEGIWPLDKSKRYIITLY